MEVQVSGSEQEQHSGEKRVQRAEEDRKDCKKKVWVATFVGSWEFYAKLSLFFCLVIIIFGLKNYKTLTPLNVAAQKVQFK